MKLPKKFMANVSKNKLTGCWNWLGTKTDGGYGCYRGIRAYRYAYTHVHGPMVHDELHLDHLCRNKACVNPEHLEVVTNEENQRRRGAYSRGLRKFNELEVGDIVWS